MSDCDTLLRRLGTALGLMAFALAFASALLAGVDPFFATVRAAAVTAGLIAVYAVLSRALVAVLLPDAGDKAGASDADPRTAH